MAVPNPEALFNAAHATLDLINRLYRSESGEFFDEEKPTPEHPAWASRIRFSDGETETAWHVVADASGIVSIHRSISFMSRRGVINNTELTQYGHVKHVVPMTQAICFAILGKTYIPVESRKEMRELVRVAQSDAAYIFSLGMGCILLDGTPLDLRDDAEVWSFIRQVAEDHVGHPLGGHKEMWRQLGITFQSYDIYEDAFVDKASELVGLITPKGN